MRNATEAEFAIVSGKAGQRRHVDGGPRCQEVECSDRGRVIASKSIFYKRGKVVSTTYRVDPSYLPGGV